MTIAPLFLSHGSPMTALEPGATGPFWQQLSAAIEVKAQKPQAILALSAHSLAREPVLLAAAKHPTVHDFSGFPDALYQLRYDAPGAPELAERVAELLILKADMPRSMHASLVEVLNNLERVTSDPQSETLRRAGKLRAQLQYGRIDEILATGMHAFLTQFLDRVNDLGVHVSREFLVPVT
jgi:hypothetical protein